MPVVILLVVLTVATAVAILYPQVRIAAVAVIVVFLGLTGIYFTTSGTSLTEERKLDVASVVLDDVGLSAAQGFSRLSGRVTNADATAQLRSFKIDLRLFDCPEEQSALEDCAVIAEDDGIARVDVPAGQTRSFESVHRFTDQPPLKGVLRWDFRVLDADASLGR